MNLINEQWNDIITDSDSPFTVQAQFMFGDERTVNGWYSKGTHGLENYRLGVLDKPNITSSFRLPTHLIPDIQKGEKGNIKIGEQVFLINYRFPTLEDDGQTLLILSEVKNAKNT